MKLMWQAAGRIQVSKMLNSQITSLRVVLVNFGIYDFFGSIGRVI